VSEYQAHISLGQSDDGVFVKIDGPATMALSAGFAALCEECRRQFARPIYIDLSTCEWLDSTFAGCLVGQRVKTGASDGAGDGSGFTVIGSSEPCREVLTKMGLAPLLLSDAPPPSPPPDAFAAVTAQTFSSEHVTETVIDAHDHLAGINDTNREVFGRIADAFRADLRRKRRSDA
jgi:hypothetical protein